MMSLYHEVCAKCSQAVTQTYSTSFYSAIKLLHKDMRQPIHGIYGFVRFADEITDTFHDYKKPELLLEFTNCTWSAINDRISMNPILHSLQSVVHKYNIPHLLIKDFLRSMEMDLYKKTYTTNAELDKYIYGSAEVVGLMCLCVFCEGDIALYEKLKESASCLGAAFQKVNFLRDLKADTNNLHRTYFPGLTGAGCSALAKGRIEQDIEEDFRASIAGIRALPAKARYGVYTAYKYYYTLFKKIKNTQPEMILAKRVRVPDYQKIFIMLQAGMYNRLNMI
jgi:phytoene synthase